MQEFNSTFEQNSDCKGTKLISTIIEYIFVQGNILLHGLRTSNEGINQNYLKNWADVADKICCRHTINFGIGIEFSAVQ